MYKRVGCDFYDRLEMYAVQGRELKIIYQKAGARLVINTKIETLVTKDKAEYLVTEEKEWIRLDWIEGLTVES